MSPTHFVSGHVFEVTHHYATHSVADGRRRAHRWQKEIVRNKRLTERLFNYKLLLTNINSIQSNWDNCHLLLIINLCNLLLK